MLKCFGYESIPEWAICYIMNDDSTGLSDEEIDCINKYLNETAKAYNADRIIFDTSVMDTEKYGNYYYDELDCFPSFGKKFGACKTWKLPLWCEVKDYKPERCTAFIKGFNGITRKNELHILKDKHFEDIFDLISFATAYYRHIEHHQCWVQNTDELDEVIID